VSGPDLSPRLEEASEPVNELFEDLPPLLARGAVWLILTLLLAAGVYSFFGRVDEIVRARAAAVPQGLVRPVQAASGGRLSRVVVQEGEQVEKDQVLVYLETEAAEATLERAREERALRERQLQDLLAGQADEFQVAEARARLAQAQGALESAQRAMENSMIVAPMTGQLTRLQVHGVGEAVQAGQTVAEVAPANAPLVFEAQVANSDVGRLRVGLPAKLKVDAFPHQEYGTVDGTVTYVSPDAAAAPDGGSYYRVRIAPGPLRPRPGKKPVVLRLGLSARAEIIADRSRIIDLLIRSLRGGE